MPACQNFVSVVVRLSDLSPLPHISVVQLFYCTNFLSLYICPIKALTYDFVTPNVHWLFRVKKRDNCYYCGLMCFISYKVIHLFLWSGYIQWGPIGKLLKLGAIRLYHSKLFVY